MRQTGLFPSISLTEETLRDIVEPLYPRLWRILRDPFDDLLVRRGIDQAFRILEEGETAQWLRPQIVERARQIFDGDPDVKIEKRNQQLFINFKNQLAITPKKLRSDRRGNGLTFSSYSTGQNLDYWQQRAVDGLPDLPRLIVGYQFVEEMTDIKIWIAYPRGKVLRTCFLVPDQVGSVIGVYQPAPETGSEENAERGYTVKPRKRREGRERGQT